MKKIIVTEVGPRDGFQNIKEYIPVDDKIKIVEMLIDSGVRHIELTSFVSPKAIPQLKDAKKISSICFERFPNVEFLALVPNLYGAKMAKEVGFKKVVYVVSLSESHNKANINRTHEESFEEFLRIKNSIPELEVVIDLATTFGCPFEGKYKPEAVVDFLIPYIRNGANNICLCDTIGIGNPKEVRNIIRKVKSSFNDLYLGVHIHDTRNMGMVNTLAAIECGIDEVQSTLGGLGGCPFAPGASGNLATEDLVYMLNGMDIDTMVDSKKIIEAAKFEKRLIPQGIYSGHLMKIESESI